MEALAFMFWALFTWLVFAFLAARPTWMLWNWLMPQIFELLPIGLFQALGLLVKNEHRA